MSATNAHPERLTRVSLALYQALLLLYPARFRQRYGAQMAQAFHDSLRTAARHGGLAGVAHVWRVTLNDLLVTVLAERIEEDGTMTRLALYRATGMVSLTGVAVWILGALGVALGLTLANILGRPLALSVGMLLPAAWMFFVIGFVGLYTWLAERGGAVVWLPGIVAIAALLAMMAGALYWTWAALYWTWAAQVGVQQMGPSVVVNLAGRLAGNERLDYYAYAVSNLGIPMVGLALIFTAWLARRTPSLRAVARTLLVMGLVSAAYYFFSDMGAPSLLRNTGAPGLLGTAAGALAFAVVWLGGWVLLGRGLWNAGATQSAQTPAPLATQTDTQTASE